MHKQIISALQKIIKKMYNVMVEEYLSVYIEEAAKIFLDIYKNPPFSLSWLDIKSVLLYFSDLEKEPNFRGFVMKSEGEAAGFCFGSIVSYFPVKKYRISEIFIKNDLQNRGVGSSFISEIEKILRFEKISVIEINTNKKSYAYYFYRKNGFIEAENIVSMIKSIKNY